MVQNGVGMTEEEILSLSPREFLSKPVPGSTDRYWAQYGFIKGDDPFWKPIKEHIVTLKWFYYRENYVEIYEWLTTNTSGKWCIIQGSEMKIRFSSKTDVLHFKMVWG